MKGLPHGSITLQEIAEFYPALALVAGATLRLDPIDPETAEWLDGPAFVRWLSERGLSYNEQIGRTYGRRVREWRAGKQAHVRTADAVCTALNLHLTQIPDSVWARPPTTTAIRIDEATREEITHRYRAGESALSLGDEFGIDARTITGWME